MGGEYRFQVEHDWHRNMYDVTSGRPVTLLSGKEPGPVFVARLQILLVELQEVLDLVSNLKDRYGGL